MEISSSADIWLVSGELLGCCEASGSAERSSARSLMFGPGGSGETQRNEDELARARREAGDAVPAERIDGSMLLTVHTCGGEKWHDESGFLSLPEPNGVRA